MSGIPGADKVNKLAFLSVAAAIVCGAPAAKSDLIGAQVTIGIYCCTAPTAPNLISNVVTGTVPVTFPVGSLVSGISIIQAVNTVSDDQIIQSFTASGTATSGGFNGAVYDFSGLSSPITNVSVDPASTLSPTSIAFTGNSVDVNEAGLAIIAGERLVVDITTSNGPVPPVTTPEPSTLALLGAGLVGFVFRRRRAH